MKSRPRDADSDEIGLELEFVREVVREARRSEPDARLLVARLELKHSVRWIMSSRHGAAQSSSLRERRLVVHVADARGIRTRETPLDPGSPTASAATARIAAGDFHAAATKASDFTAAKLTAVDSATARSVPARSTAADPDDPNPHGIWRAAIQGLQLAARGRPLEVELQLAITVESTRLVLARVAQGEREHGGAAVLREIAIEGNLQVLGPRAVAGNFRAGAWLAETPDLPPLLENGIVVGARRALERALARAREPVALRESGGRVLLSPHVLTWVLHAPIVEGVRDARAGAPAGVPDWLEVSDPGIEDRENDPVTDEEGCFAGPVTLVANGRWQCEPFRPLDGAGRTRRDPSGALVAGLRSLRVACPGAHGIARPLAKLRREADVVLTEVVSADPLPGGGVALVAHALARTGSRWAPAGLASVRLGAGEAWTRCAGVSRKLERTWAQRLPLELPWLLVRGLRVRPAE